jgi:hypothetical protein
MEKNPGGQAEHESYQSHDVTGRMPTLSDIGISRMQSSRWQLMAGVPQDKREVNSMLSMLTPHQH